MIRRFVVAAALCAAASAPAYADGDPEKGKKVFRKCQACHVVDAEKNRVGPHLVNIMGRTPGAIEGFKYSDEMREFGEEHVWDAETLDAYLEKPRAVVKGTRMAFAGLRDSDDRKNVIAYLAQFSESSGEDEAEDEDDEDMDKESMDDEEDMDDDKEMDDEKKSDS